MQGHRGDIIQGIGCYPSIYNTALAFPLVLGWPLVLSLIAIVYGLLSLRAWLKRRDMVEEFLNSNASGLNADRYFRLMCFSAVELTIVFPISLWMTLTNAINIPLNPWISWEDTHFMFNRFNQIPAAIIENNPTSNLQFGVGLWCLPGLCYLFFIFFGLGREQRNQYKNWVFAALKPFGVSRPAPKPYSRDRRTWWQKLFRQRGASSTEYGTGLSSSRGATDTLPAFRHGAPQAGSYGEKPIPSARSKPAHATLDTTMTFDFDQYDDDEKAGGCGSSSSDIAVDAVDAARLHPGYNTNKALPSSPTVVGGSLRESDADGKYSRRTTKISTSTASSVAGSSRRVSEAIRDVELSEAELRAIEARVQRMP